MDHKNNVDMIEKATVSVEGDPRLDDSHAQWLQSRYGTDVLDPVPDPTEEDPLNWHQSKKILVLLLVAFHAFMATFTAAAIQSAFVNIAEDLHVSVQGASYLTSLVIAILGGGPLLWKPLANTWGRRPILMISLIGSLIGNIGCANSPTYGTMALCRAITALFISPAAAIGSGIVVELFFKAERARYMGIWTMFVTLGVPVSPFIFGFLALRVDYRWIYYVLAITNGVQFILWCLFGFETLYIRGSYTNHASATSSSVAQLTRFRRIDPTPLSVLDFVKPLRLFARPCVVLPAVSYAMIFALTSVLITIEIPQLYPEKFGFNTQQVGLQFLSIVIGTVIGELIGGRLSDSWMSWGTKRHNGTRPDHEYRLWLSYIAIPLAVIGVSVFLVFIGKAGTHWSIVPLIGAAIAAVGNQIVTTVLITYAVDCHRNEAASIGVFITFVRQIWGFVGPFWYPQMIASVGLSGSAGIAAALIVVVSFPASILLQLKGRHWR